MSLRDDFEAAATDSGFDVSREPGLAGEYVYQVVRMMWWMLQRSNASAVAGGGGTFGGGGASGGWGQN